MTSPETTDPEVLAAAREALAKLDDDKYPLSAAATRKGENDEDIHIRVAIAAINEYRRSGSGVVKVKDLEWREFKALGGKTKLCANDCFGNELARIDLPASEEAIRDIKASTQRLYDRYIRSALAEPAAGNPNRASHDKAILDDLKCQLDDMGLVDEDKALEARETIEGMVETLLSRLSAALSTGQGGRAEPPACASADCEAPSTQYFAGGGVGSYYCDACSEKVKAVVAPGSADRAALIERLENARKVILQSSLLVEVVQARALYDGNAGAIREAIAALTPSNGGK